MHLFLYGAFRHFHDKNIGQSAMTLHSAIFQAKSIKILKSNTGVLYSAVERWRSEALRYSDDLYMGLFAILFLTPDASCLATQKRLFFKGPGSFKKILKSAEM
jgi:hypothetical protein